MAAVRAPRSVNAATALLERFAAVDGEIAAFEEARRAELAKVNGVFDAFAADLVDEHRALAAALTAWWPSAAATLTDGKRKSAELGGCEIGSRSSPATLSVAGDEKAVAAALAKLRWARDLVRRTVSIDRVAVLKSIDGAHAAQLAELGLAKVPGGEAVFVKRVRQTGTQGAAVAS